MSRTIKDSEKGQARAARRLVLRGCLAGTGTLAASLASAGVYLPPPAEAATSSSCTGTVAGVTVYGGNDQVGQVDAAYPESLQVEVVDTTGCAVPDADVTFMAPSSGASGTFTGGVTDVTVGTSSSGVATAPTFTANDVTGSLDVEAEVDGFDVDLSLTNSTVGVASSLSAASGDNQEAAPGTGFAGPLVVTVEDSSGNPVDDETVAFAVTAGSSGATASFAGAATSATAETDEDGQATSPDLTAGTTSGSFTVTASVTGVTSTASFTLTVGSGTPYAITAGAGTSQEAEAGTDFAVPLAVTVTDSDGNDVAGATVTFKAPSSGPTGVFAGAGHTVKVTTNSEGVATAPAFSAGLTAGGCVVTATVTGVSSPASFALVDEARSQASTEGAEGTYRLVTSTGRVLVSGDDAALGSLPSSKLGGSKVVAMAEAPGGKGYWVATANGKVYAFGDAKSYGSATKPVSPIVGMAATYDGDGYWLVAKDGAVSAFGDAANYGSPAKLHLTKPIVGMAATADGKGYWLVASDGGIFNYGDARYYGSTGKLHLKSPVVGMAAAPGGDGYWLVASDGGVFAFGKATYYGSGTTLSPKPVRAIVPTADGGGYWVVSADGTAAGFGDAGAQGSPTLKATTVVAGAP